MNEICVDNRFEIIEKAKKHLLEATNIETAEDEMKVLNSFLFRCWQMGWLKQYDDTIEEDPVRRGRCGACRTHDNGYGRINLYSGGGWQTAICKGVENYEMVISHNGDHFATRIDYCPYCGERLDVE